MGPAGEPAIETSHTIAVSAGFFGGLNKNGSGLVAIRAPVPLAVPAWRGFPCPLPLTHGNTPDTGITADNEQGIGGELRSFIILVQVSLQGIEKFGS